MATQKSPFFLQWVEYGNIKVRINIVFSGECDFVPPCFIMARLLDLSFHLVPPVWHDKDDSL